MTNQEMTDLAQELPDSDEISMEIDNAMNQVMRRFNEMYDKLTPEWKVENPKEAEQAERRREECRKYISSVNHALLYHVGD